MRKKEYIKPVIRKIALDNTISLIMMTAGPKPPMPRGASEPTGNPFASPFDDKSFN